jgi:hypothetical protein
MLKFVNAVPWGGLYFCHAPGDIIELEDEIAVEREKLGLGKILRDRSKKDTAVTADPAVATAHAAPAHVAPAAPVQAPAQAAAAPPAPAQPPAAPAAPQKPA